MLEPHSFDLLERLTLGLRHAGDYKDHTDDAHRSVYEKWKPVMEGLDEKLVPIHHRKALRNDRVCRPQTHGGYGHGATSDFGGENFG